MILRASALGLALMGAVSLVWAESASIPAGTQLHFRLSGTLTTKINQPGDHFTAMVSEPVMQGGQQLIPVGSTVEGRLARVERPGRLRGVGQMRLTPERLVLLDGRSFALSAEIVSTNGAEGTRILDAEGGILGPSSRKEDAKEIGIGSVIGAGIGLLTGHWILGATTGGTAALVDRLRRRGKDLTLPAGTELTYGLTRPIEITPLTPVRREALVHPKAQLAPPPKPEVKEEDLIEKEN